MSEHLVRVVVADDDGLLRTSLAALLDLQPGLEVVGQAADGEETVRVVRATDPDIALVDLEMPGVDGIEVARRLAGEPVKVVVVTRHARPAHLERALAAGAAGFVLKSTSSDDFVRVIGAIYAGQRYVDPEIATLALTMRACPLSEREREVLALVRDGARTADVAAALHLAPGTVRNYVSSAVGRLGVGSGREAADVAYAEGWI
ncbi:MAG: response regulator transcription factor [Propionibacteriales bacterium]|nr:response regulator transcription factor [Propionibacteriales bacterium]